MAKMQHPPRAESTHGTDRKRKFRGDVLFLLLAGVVAIGLTAGVWYAAVHGSDTEIRKAWIAGAGTLTAALVGVASGVASASWGDHLQRNRAKAAASAAALREVTATVGTFYRERGEAHRWLVASRDGTDSPEGRVGSQSNFLAAAANTNAARALSLSALSKALDRQFQEPIREALMALRT